MTIWIIAYDLRATKGEQDYEPLWKALKAGGSHRVQDSVWLGSFEDHETPQKIHDYFKKFMHKDDRLWISEVTSLHWYSGAMSGTTDWLKTHPPKR